MSENFQSRTSVASAFGGASNAPVIKKRSDQFKLTLLGTVAAGAMLFTPMGGAHAQVVDLGGNGTCVTVGTSATCSGDLSGGLQVTGPAIQTLNVNGLTGPIAPAPGVTGIYFSQTNGSNSIINVDSGVFGITTTRGGNGIEVYQTGNGDVTITNSGNVTSENNGILSFVDDDGDISITNIGNVTAGGRYGIGGYVDGFGDITIANTGDVSSGGPAIAARVREKGAVSVESTGDITSLSGGGIYAYNGDRGDVSVLSTGNITVDGYGIIAENDTAYGDAASIVSVTSTGDIDAGLTGIKAYNDGDGEVNVVSKGNIKAGDYGIYAYLWKDGDVNVTSTGDIESDFTGIYVDLSGYNGSVTINSVGNITSVYGYGIYSAGNISGNTVINSTGDINSHRTGIFAYQNDGGNITINSAGNINSDISGGIYAWQYDDGNVNITSTGNIITEEVAIYGYVEEDGNVVINSMGDLTSNDSYGILATINGGYGNVSVSSKGSITSHGTGIFAFSNLGGAVNVSSTGNIMTSGGGAHGIAAYIDSADGPINSVTVTSTGNITTMGRGSMGIYAYVDNGPGDVLVTSTGDIKTSNVDAHGIYAYIDRGNNGSSATVNVKGSITTTGDDSDAIRVFADADDKGVVNVIDSTIQGGSANGAGVNFQGPANSTNTLNISGEVTLSSLAGVAVLGGDGDETINNDGTLNTLTDGGIDLGAGNNAFNNNAGATFNVGLGVRLGAGNVFTNAGIFSPGGQDVVSSTIVDGDAVQTASGILLTTLDSTAKTADLTEISGSAKIAGNVQVRVINPAFGAQSQTIATAQGGATDNGIGLIASPVLQAELQFPNNKTLVLATDLDFATSNAGLNTNQNNVAANLNSVVGAGTGALSPLVMALINDISTEAEYLAALDQLGGELFLSAGTAAQNGAQNFANQLFSCKVNGVEYAAVSEGNCVWIRPQASHLSYDRTSANVGYDVSVTGMSLGAQSEFQTGWFVGGSFGFGGSSLNSDTGGHSDTTTYQGGVSLKYVDGPLGLSAAVFGGSSDIDTIRNVTAGGFTGTNRASFESRYFGGQVRAAYLIENENMYFKPLLDLNLTHLNVDGATETGTAATALTFGSNSHTFFTVSPAIEFGTDVALGDENSMRLYGKVGGSFQTDNDTSLTARFANGPAGAGSFTVNTSPDDIFGDVEVGVTFFDSNSNTLQLGYQGRFSENSQQHGGFAKASFKF